MSRATEILVEREKHWRPRLRAISLVCELDIPEDEARLVLRNLGKPYADLTDIDRRILLYDRFPACVLVGLAGIGAVAYSHGGFWPAVGDEMGIRIDSNDQKALGAAFRNALDRFALARFRNFTRVNVDEILMHAGIPLSCVADFLNALLRQQALDPDVLTPAEFMEWATAPGREARLYALDKPVQRLLWHGGAYAEDLVDRCLELVDRLREPAFVPDGLRLPDSLVKKAVDLARDGLLNLSAVRETGAGLGTRPRLLLEPYGRGLMTWLPPIPDADGGQVSWDLVIGGEPQTVRSRSVIPTAVETAPAVSVPLPRPVRDVEIALRGYDLSLTLTVVDPEDPLMVFTDEGRRIPASANLPPTSVWLMHPDDGTHDVDPVEFAGSPVHEDEPPAPYGWNGWRLRRVNVADVARLRLVNRPWRTVEGGRRPRLELSPPITHARTLADSPVWNEAPDLLLPADPETTTAWTIRIRRPHAAQNLSVQTYEVEDDTRIDPWQEVKRPLVGAYEIAVRGPLGRGISQRFEFAEGLTVSWSPRWRPLDCAGLRPAAVTASTTDPSLRVNPATVRLPPDRATADLSVSADGETFTVRVTPPHLAVQRGGTGTRSEWALRPLRLDTETIGDGHLLVLLPGDTRAELIVTDSGTQVQRVPSSGGTRRGTARFELGRIAQTVQNLGTADLLVEIYGQQYPVARCTPRDLATGVWVDENGCLVVEGGRATEGLAAGIYRMLAPWREPHVVGVRSDLRSDPLPADLTSMGDLVVHLRIEDPWVPQDWPHWPEPSNTFRVKRQSWKMVDAGDSDEAALSRYLAGKGPLPVTPGVIPFAFDLYGRADELKAVGVRADLRADAARIIGTEPAGALAHIVRARLASSITVAPLVHAGLGMLAPRQYLSAEDEVSLWGLSPAAAALASAYRLGAVTIRSSLYERLTTVCGAHVVIPLLTGDPDPYAAVGGFDANAALIARMDPDRLDALWSATPVVPGGLLDADTRLAAARELFDARLQPDAVSLAEQSAGHMRLLRPAIERAAGDELGAAVRAREYGTGWRALPALSIALCLGWRLAARGCAELAGLMPKLTRTHAQLARVAPQLTTIDLVLAELLVTGSEQ